MKKLLSVLIILLLSSSIVFGASQDFKGTINGNTITAGSGTVTLSSGKTLTMTESTSLDEAVAMSSKLTLALGAANLKAFMNAGATAPEWATGMKVGTLTRDVSLASGVVSYTGVEFKPSQIIFLANIPGTVSVSIGMGIAGGGYCIFNDHVTAAGTWNNQTAIAIYFLHSAGVASYAHLESYDADGFSIHWINGGGTGTATVFYIAFR